VISSLQKPLPEHITLTKNQDPCPWWDSNPPISAGKQSQTYALECVATETSTKNWHKYFIAQTPTVFYFLLFPVHENIIPNKLINMNTIKHFSNKK